MTAGSPKITLLNPIVLPDKRRVTMELMVENLPGLAGAASNVINFFDAPPPSPRLGSPPRNNNLDDADAADKYPNVILSIIDSGGQEVASLLIVEHKEPHTSLTLHLRAPDLTEQYIARAEMSLKGDMLEVIEVPFVLNPTSVTD